MGKLRPFVRKDSYMPNKKWIPFVIGNGYTTTDGASGPAPEYETVTGNPVSFNAITPFPLRQLKVAFSPVQDLHGYENPWPAGGGVNKLPNPAAGTVTQNGMTCVVSADGQYAVSGTTSGGSFLNDFNVAPYTIQSGDYIHCGNSASSAVAVVGLRFTNNTNFEATISTNYRIVSLENHVGKTIKSVILYVANNTTFTANIAPMIVASSASTPFAPYSNECPISGWDSLNVEQTGVNVWDEEWELGTIDGTSGAEGASTDYWRPKNYIPVTPLTDYYASCPSVGSVALRTRFYDAEKNYIGSTDGSGVVFPTTNYTLKTPANCYYVRFNPNVRNIPTGTKLSINYPSSDHDYHAYNPSSRSISISLGSTVYSGYVDVVTGVGEIDKVAATLNALTKAAAFSNGNYSAAQLYLLPSLSTTVAANQTHGAISTSGKEGFAYFGVARTNEPFPYSDGAFAITTDGRLLCVYDSDKTITSEAFDAKYGTTQIVYPLEEPLTIQLTPQEVESLAGDNVLFSDSNGDLTVTYRSN